MGQPKSVALSCFLYRAVLRLGPSTFRMELQSLLLSDFRHLCLKAHAQTGAEGVFALLPSHMLHTFCDISGEHFDLVKSWAFKMLQATLYFSKDFEVVETVVEEKVRITLEYSNVKRKRKKKKKNKRK